MTSDRDATMEEAAKVAALKGAGREAVEAIRALKDNAAPQAKDTAGESGTAPLNSGDRPPTPAVAAPSARVIHDPRTQLPIQLGELNESAPSARCVSVPEPLYRAVIHRLISKRDSSTDLSLIRQLEALDPDLAATQAVGALPVSASAAPVATEVEARKFVNEWLWQELYSGRQTSGQPWESQYIHDAAKMCADFVALRTESAPPMQTWEQIAEKQQRYIAQLENEIEDLKTRAEGTSMNNSR